MLQLAGRRSFRKLPENARRVYPAMEKTYIDMLNQMATDLAERGDEAFESEFALQEFIDRNAVKVGQFAHLLRHPRTRSRKSAIRSPPRKNNALNIYSPGLARGEAHRFHRSRFERRLQVDARLIRRSPVTTRDSPGKAWGDV